MQLENSRVCVCVCVCAAGSNERLVGDFQTANQQLQIRTALLRFLGKTTSDRHQWAWLVG